MFTGLVADLGEVAQVESSADGVRLSVSTRLTSDLHEGDSIAVNGVCLTATAIESQAFTTEVMNETLRLSSLAEVGPGARVNLELAARPTDRLGGHIVQGHIDGIGSIDRRQRQGEWEVVWFRCGPELGRYMVSKGSVAVDGVSLTLVDVSAEGFSVALIPHTMLATTLGHKQPGATVNIEIDLFAKYVFRCVEQMSPRG